MSVLTDFRQLRGEVGDFIARHEKAKDITDFAAYDDDPDAFLREVLRCTPWAKQTEMATLVRDNPRTLVLSANGIGKDWLFARLALWWVYARRGFVILTGVTERTVKTVLMRELRRAFALAPELPGELFALELRVDDDCGIVAFTSGDSADRFQGIHHPRLLILATEAQGLGQETFDAMHACATGPKNSICAYGNPTSPKGPFHKAATSGNWAVLSVSALEHPNVVSGRDEIPGAVSATWIQTVRDEYGSDSAFYRSRVLAQFPEDSVEGLFRREWLMRAFERHEKADAAESWHHSVTLSVDVARSVGGDMTAVAVCRGPVVERIVKWRVADLTVTEDKVVELAKSYTITEDMVQPKFAFLVGRPRLVTDDVAVGGGLTDRLRRLGYAVEAFNGAQRAYAPDRFLNRRAEAYWRVRMLLEKNEIALPRDDDLLEETQATEYQMAQNGKVIQIVGKDVIRAALGRSPDSLDACVMGLNYSIPDPSRLCRISTVFM